MKKFIKFDKLPGVMFHKSSSFEHVKMYIQDLTKDEYNKAFGKKSEKKKSLSNKADKNKESLSDKSILSDKIDKPESKE